jgi:hypothetical protein
MDEEGVIWLWRCLNCVDRFDDTIRWHHALPYQPEPRPSNIFHCFDPDKIYDRRLAAIRQQLGKVC